MFCVICHEFRPWHIRFCCNHNLAAICYWYKSTTPVGVCIRLHVSIFQYFSRDLYTLQLEQTDAESMEPTCGVLTIGRTVILNFLDGLQM